ALSDARGRAGPDSGVPPPPVGAFLAWLAATMAARTVVEVGGSAGVGGLWLLRGLAERAALTCIEPDADARDLAQQAYEDAGVTRRVRTIVGASDEVLGRLSDAGYDLVVMHAVDGDHEALVSHVRRILRPGGVVLVRQVAAGGWKLLDARQAFTRALIEDEGLEVAVLPIDGGIVLATVRG
ncbi:MAG: O-methyltransferase, partial [Nitriliruptorales bacterium]